MLLKKLLDTYRQASVTEREKGIYFEELILCYLRNEATYRDLYSDVWTYNDWAVETMHNPRYLLGLIMRVGTGSLEPMKIVDSLPIFEIIDKPE